MSLARPIHIPRSLLINSLFAIALLAAAGARAAPLAPSNYLLRPACSSPAPGRASCLALGLAPASNVARARIHSLVTRGTAHSILTRASECVAQYPSTCLTPQDLNSAYFPGEQPQAPASEPQTIALVDSYNDLNAEADLNTYAGEFGLPACTKANGCFRQVGEGGSEASLPFPKNQAELEIFAAGTRRQREKAEEAEGWALETATDIEVVHAVCQNCHILLVEASGPLYPELESAENTAVGLHATEISNSWGGPESGTDGAAFNHPGIAITAAAGDDGYLNWDQYATRNEAGSSYFEGADYPASSPHVISVGGTKLNLGAGGEWKSESPWNSNEGAGGSGCSSSLQAASWQREVPDWARVGCGGHRANADVSADADPYTGVNIYDSTPYPNERERTAPGWTPIGGTSVAAPIIASMFGLAGGAHGVAYPARVLYSHLGSPSLHDVASGGNGECGENYSECSGSLGSPLDCGAGVWICNATSGYDGPTGVGTPNGITAFESGEGPIESGEGEPKVNPPEEQGKPVGGNSPGSSSAQNGGSASGLGGSLTSANGAANGAANGSPAQSGLAAGIAIARISALTLTARARAALLHGRLGISQLAFSFILSRAVNVHAGLATRVGSGRGAHWRRLRASFTFAAIKGLNRRRLHGAGELARGRYRLTLTPSGGKSRSIVLRLR